MSQPSNSPPGTPQDSAAPGSRADSLPAASPPPSPGMPAQSPVRTPARAANASPRSAGTPRAASPDSNASRSPAFARTPRSGGSPAQSPLGGPVRTPLASPTRTPARRTTATAPSPTGSLSGQPAAPSPAASVRSRNTPGSSQPKVSFRGFMGSPPKTPARNRDADMMDQDDAEDDMDDKTIYGTTIKQAQVVKEFHAFIRGFRLPDQTSERPYYLQQLHTKWEECIKNSNGIKFPISGEHVHSFNKGLYDRLVNWPTEVIPIFDWELWNISVRELNGEPEEMGTCQVQVHSLMDSDSRIMRNMNPTDIERLMSLKGIVIRCSDLVPDMISATFRCTSEDCKHEVSVALSHWSIEEPTKCESCGATHSYQIVHNECTFMDRQVLKLQETPELVPEGETPQNIQVICFDDLVDTVRPGDRVEVTGIYKASAVRPIKNWTQCSSVYRTYVDAISIAAERKGRIDAPPEEYDFDASQKPALKLSAEADLDPDFKVLRGRRKTILS
jgi:DNA replication licensing factor MCM4